MVKVAYGAVFVVLVPALLAVWAHFTAPLIALPVYGNRTLAILAGAAGLALMLAGMWQLRRRGGGLPMNAFPPVRLVTTGVFRWIPHPIYSGFVLLCWGASMYAGSASGLWLVTPIAALCCASLVLGYERVDLENRFGEAWARAALLLPPNESRRPYAREGAQVLLTLVAPWMLLYGVTGEFAPRFLHSSDLISESTYFAAILVPFVAREARAVRRFAIQGWIALVVFFATVWTIPAARPDAHLLWAMLAAGALSAGRLVGRWFAWAWVAGVGISCLVTGMHTAVDVAAAALAGVMILHYERCWAAIRTVTEAVANSWREWHAGPMRIINHGFYTGLGTFAGLCLITAATGRSLTGPVLITYLAGVVGAGLWAQWVEGSPRLLRPYGFYGGLLGVTIACLFFKEAWLLLGAHALAGPWVQGIGRLRCLVQGCCHGQRASTGVGIIVRRAESRVTRLAGLGGVPIHATQLYSLLWSVLTGLVLARVWAAGAPLNLVGGLWLILNGIGRFAEERYRGEPQTKNAGGLHLYQWLAIGSVLGGVAVTCIPGVEEAPALAWSKVNVPLAAAGFMVTSFAMGVDFPASNRRFARLT